MRFKKFTKPTFLRSIGRDLLTRLFERFAADFDAKQIQPPSRDIDDFAFNRAITALVTNQEGLPGQLLEALFAIEEMSTEEGLERLEMAAMNALLPLPLPHETTRADFAVQVWLLKPDLLVETHNEIRLWRLSGFEYYGSRAPKNQEGLFENPSRETLQRIESDVDNWCQEHNRGEGTAQIESYEMGDEFWFLIRHGDTFTRQPKVEGKRREILHYRPEKDDVVVYSPKRDELRIHAATKGEREMYRKAFGRSLFMDEDQFSKRRAYTLNPLIQDGADALEVTAPHGITRIKLIETEFHFRGRFNESVIRKSDDIFESAKAVGRDPFPTGGQFARAKFEVTFADSRKTRKVEIRPPNVLKLGRFCDAATVQRWLGERGFRASSK